MVWALVMTLLFPTPAYADQTLTAYDSIFPNDRFWSVAERCTNKINCRDYVFVKSGQYEAYLIYGDVGFSNGVFTCEDCDFIRWYRDGTSEYRTNFGSFSGTVSPGVFVVASSLGGYPDLGYTDTRGVYDRACIGLCALALIACAPLVAFVTSMSRSLGGKSA